MRISTNQIYDNGVRGILNNQSSLYKLQDHISAERRVLTPEDDPVAAAQALVVTQSQMVNAQHADNQTTATSQLGLVDSQLSSLKTLIDNVRERVVQAGNTGTMNNSDRQSIATELESRLSELLGIANSQNGAGDYLFSGYRGATLPFAIDASTTAYNYSGDDGERLLQVSASRQMAVSVAGSDLFMAPRNGNGSFVTATGGSGAGVVNQGSGLIDAGSVLDPQKWQAAVNLLPANPTLQIQFSVDGAGRSMYQLFDATTATPVALGAASLFTPGQAVSLVTTATSPPATVPAGTDFGSQVVIQGQPKAGDTFTIKPSSSQSLFQTMQSLIKTLATPIATSSTPSATSSYPATEFSNALSAQLANLDQASSNVSRIQSIVGTNMNELDSLVSTSSDLDIQYQSTLKDLVGLDYVKALSEYSKQQVNLEAAQKSFVQISGLSLFNYL